MNKEEILTKVREMSKCYECQKGQHDKCAIFEGKDCECNCPEEENE